MCGDFLLFNYFLFCEEKDIRIKIYIFVIIILMSLTSIVSKQTEKIRKLTQQIAMYEWRIRKLEEECQAYSSCREDYKNEDNAECVR